MQAMPRISVLVIAHPPAFVQMVSRFLDEPRACTVAVVGAVFRPDDALALAGVRRPQVIVLGLDGNTAEALALIAPLRLIVPDVKIIAIVQLGLVEYQQAALNAGIDRFLSVDTLHHDLFPAIAALAGGPAADTS
jgi:DNA-binding NarL/FixJ family response regulator